MNKAGKNAAWSEIAQIVEDALMRSEPVRLELPCGGRVHIDRPLPFLCIHSVAGQRAAEDIAVSNAAYLIAQDLTAATPIITQIGEQMRARFGAFIVLEVAEHDCDEKIEDDSPFLAPFNIEIVCARGSEDSANARMALPETLHAIESAFGDVNVQYRTPQISTRTIDADDSERPAFLSPEDYWVRLIFAPIYRKPNSEDIYPDLFVRLVANIFDAALQGLNAFMNRATSLSTRNHRALGRRIFVDAVRHVDNRIDEICRSFDFLLAVTPINSRAALDEFSNNGYSARPRLLYRPIEIDVDVQKKKLFSIPFDQLEDPVLGELYREKQLELDLQLTMLGLRGTNKFREASRVLYGPVENELCVIARSILENTVRSGRHTSGSQQRVDCWQLKAAAEEMIRAFQVEFKSFDATVEVRTDIPAGLMVSGSKLLVSRDTNMTEPRVQALLHHEIGVHLLTYFNGEAQGLNIFRSGLGGYEGVQEGLAVFAEYAAGGMTVSRLRLLAARVLACRAMLDGAAFSETFRLLHEDHGFSEAHAFYITIRAFRSGGLAKDAIYLRGLMQVLSHLANGGSLDPFWMGKIAISHLETVEELRERGLLRPAPLKPLFLNQQSAKNRIDEARRGLEPIDLVA